MGFDIFIVLTAIGLNIFLYKRPIKFELTGCIGSIVWLFLFGIIFPILSIMVDVKVGYAKNHEADSFNFMYLTLKIPFYWLLGLLEFAVIKRIQTYR